MRFTARRVRVDPGGQSRSGAGIPAAAAPSPSTAYGSSRAVDTSRFRHTTWLLVLISTYVSLLLIARWLSYLLFQGHERHVWQQPGLGETAYLVFTTCLPVWIWAMVLYLLARR